VGLYVARLFPPITRRFASRRACASRRPQAVLELDACGGYGRDMTTAPENAALGLLPTGHVLELIDAARLVQAQLLKAGGLGPIETPARVALELPLVTLKAYGAPGRRGGAPVLLVPAPIKRAYLWDLDPRRSIVRRLLVAGMQPYVVQWERRGPEDADAGLAAYADRLLGEALRVVEAETGARSVACAGHSLGGTFAAIHAALHPERIRALALLGAPLHFGEDAGAMAGLLRPLPEDMPVVWPGYRVPGSALSLFASSASPVTFGYARWLDGLLSAADPQRLEGHLRATVWSLDELPLPRALFAEVVQWLYREDRLLRGTLMLDAGKAEPRRIRAPVLSVIDPDCPVVPPESVLPFHRALRSETRVLWYEGDTGVALQHVGMLIGDSAHRRLWPAIIQWLSSPSRSSEHSM
jgi:polyhydroxyalkanoate synthase subunit PhaC